LTKVALRDALLRPARPRNCLLCGLGLWLSFPVLVTVTLEELLGETMIKITYVSGSHPVCPGKGGLSESCLHI
jgi:hypothetical protein